MKRTEHREFFQHLLQDYKDLFTDAVPNGPQIDPETTIRHNNSKITGKAFLETSLKHVLERPFTFARTQSNIPDYVAVQWGANEL